MKRTMKGLCFVWAMLLLGLWVPQSAFSGMCTSSMTCCETDGDCEAVCSVSSYLVCATDDDCSKMCSISAISCTSNEDCTGGPGDVCDLCTPQDCQDLLQRCSASFAPCDTDDDCSKMCSISAISCTSNEDCTGGPGDVCDLCLGPVVGVCSESLQGSLAFCMTDGDCADSCLDLGNCVGGSSPGFTCLVLPEGQNLGICSSTMGSCLTDEDCSGGVCLNTAEPMGYCSPTWSTLCQADEHCPGAYCVLMGECSDDAGSCFTPAYLCNDYSAFCSSNDDCTYGGSCLPAFQCVNNTTQECDSYGPPCFDTQGSTDCPEGYTCGGDYSCCTAQCDLTPFIPGDPFCGEGTCETCFGECTAPADCDDSNACTVEDCVDYQCQNTPLGCDDQNQCTVDSCDEESGCVNTCNATDRNDPCCDSPACQGNPVCATGPCAAPAHASAYESSPLHGSLGMGKNLAYFMLPLGAMIGLMIWRRKR